MINNVIFIIQIKNDNVNCNRSCNYIHIMYLNIYLYPFSITSSR